MRADRETQGLSTRLTLARLATLARSLTLALSSWLRGPAFCLALVAAIAACAPGKALSPEEIKEHGTVTLRTPAEKAYRAVHEALKALGYEIEEETPDKGLIVTKRRPIPDLSVASTTGGMFSRRYTIEIKDFGGMSRVTATPAIYENDKDVSARKLWDLEGGLGERELWKQLFAKVEQLL
jgi:hypothetical protein